jgi:isoleucyl-tRNA synthetase
VDQSAPESIHLCDYPEVNEAWIDEKLEAAMDEVMHIVVLGRAARNASAIKNRQPLAKMYVKADFALDSFYAEIVTDELNVKALEFAEDLKVEYSIKPQLKTVGPKFGKLVGGIRKALGELDGAAAVAELNANGVISIDVSGQKVELAREDLLIETAQTEGFVTQADQGVTVMLDTELTEELVEEGFVAELISKIQTMRKEAGFEVMDRIKVYAKDNDRIASVLEANKEKISGTVLADDIVIGECKGYEKEWKINSEKVVLGVEKQ